MVSMVVLEGDFMSSTIFLQYTSKNLGRRMWVWRGRVNVATDFPVSFSLESR